jgi:hypothetical protein
MREASYLTEFQTALYSEKKSHRCHIQMKCDFTIRRKDYYIVCQYLATASDRYLKRGMSDCVATFTNVRAPLWTAGEG